MTLSTAGPSASDCEPQFSWDIDVSNQPFWTKLGPSGTKVARAFLSCCNGHDLAEVQCAIGEETEDKMKLMFLRDKINKVLLAETARVVPSQLRDVNYTRWRSLQAALTTMEYFLGRLDTVERLGRELYEHGPDGNKDLSALHALSGVLEEEGKYSEAEAAARLVLPWLQSHPKLGDVNSPQALGSMKIIVKSLWKQGRITEAQIWVEKCTILLYEMQHGKFKKYREDEMRRWEDDLHALHAWQ